MPIRFRCAYCNQLLGISRRKVGTVIRCPKCAGQVIVPSLESEEQLQDHEPAFHGHDGSKEQSAHDSQDIDVERIDFPDGGHYPAGFRASPSLLGLSLRQVVLLGAIVLILLALAFGAGYVVGRS